MGFPDAFGQGEANASAALHVQEELEPVDFLAALFGLDLAPEDAVVDVYGAQVEVCYLQHAFGMVFRSSRALPVHDDDVSFLEAGGLVYPPRGISPDKRLAKLDAAAIR